MPVPWGKRKTTQKLLKKKKKLLQIDFYSKPETKAPKREGNSFGFLLTATWDTQKGQSCCFSHTDRGGKWPGSKRRKEGLMRGLMKIAFGTTNLRMDPGPKHDQRCRLPFI